MLLQFRVKKILSLDKKYSVMTDSELKNTFHGLPFGSDASVIHAFAIVREADWRVLGMRPYPVQVMAGLLLNEEKLAELATGEGKTLSETMPAAYNALSGKGVHIVTVNDYLARRDMEQMRQVYSFLGLTTGLTLPGMSRKEKQEAYQCSITYGTNNELGFDYLRDNMAKRREDIVQRGHNFAIVDEVDSILIDEARTPLIISGQGEKNIDSFRRADDFVRTLHPRVVSKTDTAVYDDDDEKYDYVVEEKDKSAVLTAKGTAKAEKYFGVENLADITNAALTHYINQALKAHGTMKKDRDYVVKDGEVLIVDEFTGRILPGRRYSDGLHQAIEAKEGVEIHQENQTMASITFQNYFRMYTKLSGMTGTAMTEKDEFMEIYGLECVKVPTNRPVARKDYPDRIYSSKKAKLKAVVDLVSEKHEKGQPLLIGTSSVENSEQLSKMLDAAGIRHNTLNAKNNEKEAKIIAQAGRIGAVTIATNMAGRGTDIMLGGNPDYLVSALLRRKITRIFSQQLAGTGHTISEEPVQKYINLIVSEAAGFAETDDRNIKAAKQFYRKKIKDYKKLTDREKAKVIKCGGLYVIGTERSESRRVDNQLRGRAGRQGDPGESEFFVSLEDKIIRVFGSDYLKKRMAKHREDTPIKGKRTAAAVEKAQKSVESRDFQARKNVTEYDDVTNSQRALVYRQRRAILDGADISQTVVRMIHGFVRDHIGQHGKYIEEDAQLQSAVQPFNGLFMDASVLMIDPESGKLSSDDLLTLCMACADKAYEYKEQELGLMSDGKPYLREVERQIVLQVMDRHWISFLDDTDRLRQEVKLRAYGNEQPVEVFKRESAEMFDQMTRNMRDEIVRAVYLSKPISG